MNLLLAHALADILEEECLATWPTMCGVPDVVKLNTIDEQQNLVARYARWKAAQGRRTNCTTSRAA